MYLIAWVSYEVQHLDAEEFNYFFENKFVHCSTHNWKVICLMIVLVSGLIERHVWNESSDSTVRCNLHFTDDCLVRFEQCQHLRSRSCNRYFARANCDAIDCLLSWKGKQFVLS